MRYELPDLPYDDALEPYIDSRIMELHHGKHHQGYVNGANAALDTLEDMRDAETSATSKASSARSRSTARVTSTTRSPGTTSIPTAGGEPGGDLADAIEADFGSFEAFRSEFSAAAAGVEGSGWAMLCYDHLGEQLLVVAAENHRNQTPQTTTPLFVCDVWEHAYYLQYENNRGEYVENVFEVANWDDVADRYARCQGVSIEAH